MVVEQIIAAAGNLNAQSAILFFVVLLLTISWLSRPKNLPPGPRPWPIFGNARSLVKGKLHIALGEWAERYGSLTSVWMGRRLVLVLNDMHAVKEALIKQADCFSDRVTPPAQATSLKGSIIMSNGEVWKERRRFGLTAMRNLGMGKRSVEHKVNEEACHVLDSFDAEGGKPFDPAHVILNAVSNIICMISFGYRFEYSDPKFAHLIHLVKTNLSSSSPAGISLVYRILYRSDVKKRQERVRNIAEFIQGIVREHQASFDENDIRDVIDMYIREIIQQEQQGKYSSEDTAFHKSTIWRGIFDLFVAGTDTTTNTLMWLVLYMAVYPDVQKKVQEEIDSVIGSDRRPTIDDRNSMPYTHAVLLEIQRQRPVTPFGVPHETAYETELLGYTIPARTMVFVNLWRILNDPTVWKDPESFNPTRFLSKDGKTLEKYDAFIPFSTGRRVCLGETLAKMEMFIFSVNLLQRFSFSLPVGKPRPSLEGIAGITLGPHPYEIVAKNR